MYTNGIIRGFLENIKWKVMLRQGDRSRDSHLKETGVQVP